MILWMSAEMQTDVVQGFREVRKEVEIAVNKLLEPLTLNEKAEKWAVIAVIRDTESEDYNEVVKRSSAGKVLEFRLKISHDEFLVASRNQRICLVFQMLARSADLMQQLKVSDDTIAELKNVLLRAKDPSAVC